MHGQIFVGTPIPVIWYPFHRTDGLYAPGNVCDNTILVIRYPFSIRSSYRPFRWTLFAFPARKPDCIISHQFEQVVVLPVPFPGRGGVIIGGVGSVPNRSCSIYGSSNGMGGNMGGCQCLAGGPGSGARCIVLCTITGGSVGSKGGFSNIGHPEDTSTYPVPARFYGGAWAGVSRAFLLEVGKYTLCTVSRPDCQYGVVVLCNQLCNRLVQGGDHHFSLFHIRNQVSWLFILLQYCHELRHNHRRYS